MGSRSGGERQFIPTLARAAVAAGVDGVFLEVHPDPDSAPSDAASMLPIKELVPLIRVLKTIEHAVKIAVDAEEFPSSTRVALAGSSLAGVVERK